MNIFFSYLILVIVLNESVSGFGSGSSIFKNARFTPEAVIHQLSEQIRFLIRSGNTEKGVPVLDPYEFQLGKLEYKGETLKANINVTNGNFTGLGNFRLQPFNFSKSEIAIGMNVDIPLLKFYSEHYELDGNFYDAVPLKGHGVAYIEVHDISVWGKLYLKQSTDGKAILLDKIEAGKFSVQRIVSRTQFDNNIDGIINSMVEDLLADYLTRFSQFIAATYSDAVVQYLNKTLDKFDTWNLIAVLLSCID